MKRERRMSYRFDFVREEIKVLIALLFLLIGFGQGTAFAQNDAKVSGIVVEKSDNLPLIGVTVAVIHGENTQTMVVTDAEGKFNVSVPKGDKLRFSYIGFKSKVVTTFSSDMKVVLEEDATSMEDVVVNGFFTRDKKTYTGAAQSYNTDELMKVSPTNVMQALATLDPALTINKNNAMGSNPNVVPDLVLRSTTSLATSNQTGLNSPLIVIDGVESTLQALYDINMQDIERIQVLKDASATALYGENAANGVIVIERKKVSQSPVRIRYTITPEFNFADLSSYDLCNSAQKLELEKLAGLFNSTANDGTLDQDYYDKLALVASGVDVDWKSKPVRNSISNTHSVSISGRGSGLDYNITGNYADVQGVMKNDSRKRYGMNVYLSYRWAEKLVLTLRAEHTQVDVNKSNYGSYSDWLLCNPYDSPYDSYGNLRKKLSYEKTNPLYEASLSSFNKSDTRTDNISLNARYNFKPNLYLTAQFAYETSKGTTDIFTSPESAIYADVTDLSQRGSYYLGNDAADNWSAKVVGNWIKNFDNKGTMLTVNAGAEAKRDDSTSKYLYASGFLSDAQSDFAYATSFKNGTAPGGTEALATSVGVFAAANFIYLNKYIIDGSYRISGSSKFGTNNQYAPFWSVGLGYNLHNEDFVKKLGFVDMFRIRGSYGYTGSVKFDANQAVSTYYYNSSFIHYTGMGAIPYTMANPDLTWQTTKKTNIGLTSSFFGERLNVNFDYYHEYTDDMLIDVSLPPSAGATTVKDNYGAQASDGIEFSVWGKIIQTKDWAWNVSVNGLHSKTTIKDISSALKRQNQTNAGASTESAPRILYEEGESPTAIYAVRSAGIDPASGREIYIKKDGTYTFTYDVNDKVVVGDTNPDVQGTISTSLSYKRWTAGVNFSYTLGGDIYNNTRVEKIESINPRYNADVRAFTERWKKPGDVVPYLNLSTEGGTSFVHSSRFVENENELWLSSLYVQYDVPATFLSTIGFHKLYLSLGASDLFRMSTVKYERGTSYPYSRSVNLTCSLTF